LFGVVAGASVVASAASSLPSCSLTASIGSTVAPLGSALA
jgi:hypothetical protein